MIEYQFNNRNVKPSFQHRRCIMLKESKLRTEQNDMVTMQTRLIDIERLISTRSHRDRSNISVKQRMKKVLFNLNEFKPDIISKKLDFITLLVD